MQITENLELIQRAAQNTKMQLKPYGVKHAAQVVRQLCQLDAAKKTECIKYGFLTKKMLRG